MGKIKVSVIGDGGWGTALALLLHSKGVDVVLWGAFGEYVEYLKKHRENTKFLKGVPLSKDLKITADERVAKEAEYAVFVTPCEYLRRVADRFSGAGFKYVISATKGIENTSLERPSQILKGFFSKSLISVLSGPSISYEVARRMPTTVVAASENGSEKEIQGLFMAESFRIYTSRDVIGVELSGALKNVIAIAAGISDGLGYGTNTKAALLTRGLSEITRLGVKMGAKRETFSGLSGVGDLATTCISLHSRNRWFGEEIGKGKKVKEILASTEMVVEGMATARSADALSKKYGVDMPITRKVYEIIYEGEEPARAVKELMTREAKEEDH